MAQICYRGQKTPGFCPGCCDEYFGDDYIWDHKIKNCQNPPFCHHHNVFGHEPTFKCARRCVYCGERHHTMQFCRKLKNCVLCGKSGHNPKMCWIYDTIELWMWRAEVLGRCGECLTLFETDETNCDNEMALSWACCSKNVLGYNDGQICE